MSKSKKNEVTAESEAAPPRTGNGKPAKIELPLHRRVDTSFLQYASYVIRDRAIPNLADGLKPVQRRILWTLHKMEDGRFNKVAKVVGQAMQYHPHGDASIGDALVVLANKRYLIEGQGNFGNLFTGDVAAAPRYIECRLTDGRLAEAMHHGDSCAICAASADVLIELAVGRPVAEVGRLGAADVLERLQADIRPTRMKCVTLPITVLQGALEGREVAR